MEKGLELYVVQLQHQHYLLKEEQDAGRNRTFLFQTLDEAQRFVTNRAFGVNDRASTDFGPRSEPDTWELLVHFDSGFEQVALVTRAPVVSLRDCPA